MIQRSFFEPPLWSITQLTRYLRALLENDPDLQDLWVHGEISNFSRPSSGHLYFTLKDNLCSLRCVMWRSTAARLGSVPRDGEAVEVHGSIGVYEAGGQYQLYVDLIRPAGEGALYQEFLRLKARLEAEGLFEPARKRAIPLWPQVIGIVTSPTGAALRDMLNTIRRRYPLGKVILAPCTVQGEDAPASIVNAIQALNRLGHPDVILLARGGGSIEDLWAFNDERVARAIAASAAPVISGVGHETDFTIADFAADLRAPTPTAAAELATPHQDDLRTAIKQSILHLEQVMVSYQTSRRLCLNRLENRLIRVSPLARVRSDRQRLDDLSRRLTLALQHLILLEKARLDGSHQRLLALNPQTILRRGYTILTHPGGQSVYSVHQVQPGDTLEARLSDGWLQVQVLQTQPQSQEP